MMRSMLKSKLHTATVTEANLEYVGSLTVDVDLLEAVALVHLVGHGRHDAVPVDGQEADQGALAGVVQAGTTDQSVVAFRTD